MYSIPISIGRYTDPGPRNINEDAHFVVTFPADHASEVIAVLGIADGMGGLKKGQEASFSVLDTFQRKITEQVYGLPPGLSKGERLERLKNGIEEDFMEANEEILRFKSADKDVRAPLGSTMTVAVVMNNVVLLGHVGDSRACLIKGEGQFEQLTDDHSVGKKLLNRLGLEGMYVQIVSRRIDIGEALILCTDGILDVVPAEEISRIVLTAVSIQEACNELVFKAKKNGTADNATALALEYGRLKRRPAEKPQKEAKRIPSPAAKGAVPRRAKTRAKVPAWRKAAYAAMAFLFLVTGFFGWLALKQYRSQRGHSPSPAAETKTADQAAVPDTTAGEERAASSPPTQNQSDNGVPEKSLEQTGPSRETRTAKVGLYERDASDQTKIFHIPNKRDFPRGIDIAGVRAIPLDVYPRVPRDLKLEFYLDGVRIQPQVQIRRNPADDKRCEIPLDFLDAFLKTAKDYELKIKWAETDQAPETVIVKDSRLAELKIPPKPRLEDLAAKFNESFKVECPTVLTSRDKVFLRYSQQALDELRALMPKHALPMVISVQRSASKESSNDLDYQLDDEDRENGISIDQIAHGEILSSGPYFLLGKIVLQGESIPPIETPAQGFHYLEDVRLISPFDSAATELNILFQWESYEPKPSEVYILSIADSPDLLDKKTNGAGHIHEEIPWNENSIEINLSGKAEKLGITHGNKRGMILFWKVSCWIVHGLKPYRVSSPVRTLIIKS